MLVDFTNSAFLSFFVWGSGLALLALGVIWPFRLFFRRSLPSLSLIVIGLGSAIGGLVGFHPWTQGGLGFIGRVVLLLPFLVGGVALIVGGYRWYQQQRVDYPSILLAGILSHSVFALYCRGEEFVIQTPLIGLLIFALLLGVILTVVDDEQIRLST